jgi:hypothetical protein
VAGVNIDSCPTVDFLVGGIDQGVSGPPFFCGVGPPRGVFSGLITDVGVWNETLNASQVVLLYQNPNNPFVAAPEPASFGLLVVGLGGLLVLRRRA